MNGRRAGNLRNLVLLAFTIALTLLAAEAILRVADFPRQPMKPDKIKDPILVYKIPASWPGVDADGFRNRSIPKQADIVTLGDSHTYGLNADIDTNWPGQLAKLTGLSIYNLGIGGYGPLQYYYLFDRALQLKPKTIVVGLYLPNDIKGVCHPYQQTDYWKTHAAKEELDLAYCGQAKFSDEEGRSKKQVSFLQKTAGLLVNSNIGVLASITARRFRAYLPKNNKRNVVVSNGKNDTIMSKPRLRVLHDSMDLRQPEIVHSVEITKTLLSRMSTRAKSAQIKFVVIVIPSKELVFHQYLGTSKVRLPEIYDQMAKNESELRNKIMSWLGEQDILYVDAAPQVLDALKTRGGIYPHDNDGHPLATGYQAYAEAVYRKLTNTHVP